MLVQQPAGARAVLRAARRRRDPRERRALLRHSARHLRPDARQQVNTARPNLLSNYIEFTFSEQYNGVRNGTNQRPTNQAKGQTSDAHATYLAVNIGARVRASACSVRACVRVGEGSEVRMSA